MEVAPLVSAGNALKALVVCHAGVGVGLGHLTRALVVARALRDELGAQVHLLVQGDAVELDAADVFYHQFVPSEASILDAVIAWVRLETPQLLVFDLHPKRVPSGIDSTFADLRAMGCKLIAVDALADYSDFLDLVFIPSFQFNASSAQHSTGKYICGWDCFLLNVRQYRRSWHRGSNVLVLSGGSDATGLGKAWPTRLNATLPANTALHWVTGPFAAAPVWPERPRTAMTNHVAPKGLDRLMREANYAVTVYGVSFYELLYYGVPTVVFSPYGNKDNAELHAIGEMGLAILADDEIDATEKLVALMADGNMAAALSRRAMEKMAVLGGHTFAKHAAALLE